MSGADAVGDSGRLLELLEKSVDNLAGMIPLLVEFARVEPLGEVVHFLSHVGDLQKASKCQYSYQIS